ncbi:MAG TPA: glycosyl hydrolase [Phycisphaerae bacterium]
MRLSSPAAFLCALACLSAGFLAPARADVTQLQKDFQTPPDDARIMVRFWWFGPAVTKSGIDRELTAMKTGGVGGFEVQPTYPLVVDSGSGDTAVKNLKFMSPEFLSMLGYTAQKAKDMGMRMDVTLGSGWPYGGPMFNQATDGTKALDVQTVAVQAGQTTIQAGGRNAPFAAFAGPAGAAAGGGGGGGGGGRRGGGGGAGGDLSAFKEIPLVNGVAQLPAGFAGGEVIFFGHKSAGLTAVKRPAYGADGPIIDHLSAKAVDKFIELVAEPELKACGNNPPFSIFCDSLEVNGENWTDDFLAQFQKLRGYDLKPLLPALVGNIGPQTESVRHDYGQTVTDLFNQNFNAKFTALAKKYNTRFRIQGYGSPPAALYSYAYADLPEGEAGGNGMWRNFRATRYASSASHLMNQRLTSSETFTWLHQAPFRAIPTDIKGEADLHFLEGVNQIDCHGWPYTPDTLAYPGASFYAAAVFDDKNPWYVAMPEITGYMQRVSQMMREGTPGNDIALYLNDADVWAGAGTGFSSMNAAYTGQTNMLDAILNMGYNLDGWDDGMLAMKGKADAGTLAFGNVKYPVAVLNGATHMPIETARKLEEFTKGGGLVVAIRSTPTIVPGFKATAADQEELKAIMGRIFAGIAANGGGGAMVQNETAMAAVIAKKIAPDVTLTPANPAIGVIHRHVDGNEIYFVANTSAQKQTIHAAFRIKDLTPESWNPLNGKVSAIKVSAKANDTTAVDLDLDAYGSTLVVFTNRKLDLPAGTAAAPIDLSAGWSVKFAAGPGGTGNPVDMPKLQSWTDLPGMQNYSGVASYEKKVTIPAAAAKASMLLTFGDSNSGGGGGGGRGGQGFAATINPPVRDAAVVYVNDKRAGAAWCPPFQVDVTGLLKEGENTIRIDVGNTAVNYLNKAGFPNYNQRAVDAMFPPGNRFQPQGTNLYAQPLPSGLTGPIKLEPLH